MKIWIDVHTHSCTHIFIKDVVMDILRTSIGGVYGSHMIWRKTKESGVWL